jgi:MFS family permease
VGEQLSGGEHDAQRRRIVRSLSSAVALGATGYIGTSTVSTLAGEALAGSPAWAGAPFAVAILGTAASVGLLSWVGSRPGRRPALTLGYASGAVAAVVAVLALAVGSLPLLLVAMLSLGAANASSQLSRYVGGDLYAGPERARAIGLVVWGATAGAVVGPNLVGPSGAAAEGAGLSPLAGAYVIAAICFALAAVVTHARLRPDPGEPAAGGSAATGVGSDAAVRGEPDGDHTVATALLVLVAGQVAMVMVMTMTPLHLRDHGHALSVVGLVLSAHTLGMFALSPISGRLAARFGPLPVVLAGFGLMAVAALLAALAPPNATGVLLVALFLLGFGWSLGFVAGSALLAGRLDAGSRARTQGGVDIAVWTSSALASFLAGPLVGLIGFAGLALLTASLIAIPVVLVVLVARRPALDPI